MNIKDVKPSFKDGIMDAIKVGIPGVIPQLKSGSNDPHIRWTLIGLEDQLWGKSVSLSGIYTRLRKFNHTTLNFDSAGSHNSKIFRKNNFSGC